MTAETPVPSGRLRAAHGPGLAAWQLLRLELRRSPLLPLLPLLAVLLAFTELRNDLSHLPLWPVRSTDLQVQVELTGGIVAGVAAWTAGRDRRRHLTDLVMATSRPRWLRQLAAWLAVTGWGLVFYAACVAVVFGVTARQATWGGPIWWLPGVGAAAIVALSAVGFAFGALFPGRFAAPLVTVGALLAPQIGTLALQRHHAWGRVSPAEVPTVPGTGIFFPFHGGLSIVQVIFLAGVSAAALGVLALPAAAGGRWLRRAGAMTALAGLAAAAVGVALADTARQEAQGVIIPALHTAASDKLITYTQACDSSATPPICLHPAFRAMLPTLAAALGPAFSQVAGLPGGPVRVQLSKATPQDVSGDIGVSIADIHGSLSITGGPTISGTPPVLYLSPSLVLLHGSGASFTQGLRSQVAVTIIQTMIYGGPPAGQRGSKPGGKSLAKPAQQAIATALLIAARVPLSGPSGVGGPPPGATYAAARRFAALPAAARHAWLAAHLARLRAGRITLAEIP